MKGTFKIMRVLGDIVVVLIGGLLLSCNQSSELQAEIKEVDYLDKTGEVLEGEIVTKILGSHSLVAYDSLVLVITKNSDALISIYSTDSKTIIGSIGTKGRAGNEFVDAYTGAEQVIMRNGHMILPLYDGPYEVKEVDITESLIENKTVICSTFDDCVPLVNGEFVYLGTDITNRFEYIRNIYGKEITGVPCKYTVFESNGKKRDIQFFKKLMPYATDNRVREAPYATSLYKHPLKNLVLVAFEYNDYLLFADLDNNHYYASHQLGSKTFEDVFDVKQGGICFGDAAVSNDYIMILYWRGKYTTNEPEESQRPELLIFDWDGNYVSGYKMDRIILRIEFDQIHNHLYGLSDEEELCLYDMNALLN